MRIPLSVSALLLALTATAQERTPQPDGTDGARIESELRNVVNNCFGDYAKYSPNFLPDTLRESRYRSLLERPTSARRLVEGVKFEFLARSVFDGGSDFYTQIRDTVGRSSPIDVSLPDSLPVNGTNSLVFAFTCSSALKLALEQNFKFAAAFPGTATAGIKQSLQVQADSSRRTSLALMYGTFRSPLSLALDSNDLALKAHASAAVWSFYLTQDGKLTLGKAPTYLKSARGWLISRVSSRDLTSMLAASLAASGGVLGFEANLSNDARIKFDSSFASADFTIILDEELNASRDFLALPKPADLISNIARAAQHFPQNSVPFIKGKPIRLDSKFRGIPAWLCNSQWSTKTTPETQISGPFASFNQATNSCDVHFYSTVDTDAVRLDVLHRNESFPLNVGSNASSPHVEVRHSYALQPANDPSPIQSADTVVTHQSDQANPTFGLSVLFNVMPNDPVAFVSVRQPPTITCDGTAPLPNLYPANSPQAPANAQYAANMVVTFPAQGFEQRKCKVKVPVTLTLRDGNSEVQRILNSAEFLLARPATPSQ